MALLFVKSRIYSTLKWRTFLWNINTFPVEFQYNNFYNIVRCSGNSSKWQLIETATHRMPFRDGNSSKKFSHKSPTFDELPPQWQNTECPLRWQLTECPLMWQLTECPLRWQLTECPLEVPCTKSTINHSFIQYFVHSVNGCFHLSNSSKIEKTSSNQIKRLYWHPILT
jgi:hypothetical protein